LPAAAQGRASTDGAIAGADLSNCRERPVPNEQTYFDACFATIIPLILLYVA